MKSLNNCGIHEIWKSFEEAIGGSGSLEEKLSPLDNGGWERLCQWLEVSCSFKTTPSFLLHSILLTLAEVPLKLTLQMLQNIKHPIIQLLDKAVNECIKSGVVRRETLLLYNDLLHFWLGIIRDRSFYKSKALQSPQSSVFDNDSANIAEFRDEVELCPDADLIWWKVRVGESSMLYRLDEKHWFQLRQVNNILETSRALNRESMQKWDGTSRPEARNSVVYSASSDDEYSLVIDLKESGISNPENHKPRGLMKKEAIYDIIVKLLKRSIEKENGGFAEFRTVKRRLEEEDTVNAVVQSKKNKLENSTTKSNDSAIEEIVGNQTTLSYYGSMTKSITPKPNWYAQNPHSSSQVWSSDYIGGPVTTPTTQNLELNTRQSSASLDSSLPLTNTIRYFKTQLNLNFYTERSESELTKYPAFPRKGLTTPAPLLAPKGETPRVKIVEDKSATWVLQRMTLPNYAFPQRPKSRSQPRVFDWTLNGWSNRDERYDSREIDMEKTFRAHSTLPNYERMKGRDQRKTDEERKCPRPLPREPLPPPLRSIYTSRQPQSVPSKPTINKVNPILSTVPRSLNVSSNTQHTAQMTTASTSSSSATERGAYSHRQLSTKSYNLY